jgi:hypothetical protein
MKRRNQLELWPAIGLVIDQKQIAVCVTAATAKGRCEIHHEIQDCDDRNQEEIVGRMLERWLSPPGAKRRKPRPWIRLGIPEARVFQAALPITPANHQHTPQNFFLEAVQATNVRAEDRIVELIKVEIGGRSLACVAASPRNIVESSIGMISKLGGRVGLMEPVPAALFRAGAYHSKAPRGSRLCVRFFLGELHAVGVLGAGSRPLFWHAFDLPSGDEIAAIHAAYSTLWMMGRHARITLPIDTVIIHGRPELALVKQSEEFRQRTGARLVRSDKPDYDLRAAALGLALANPLADSTGVDLARTLKSPVSIVDVFPYGELLLHSALLGAVSLFSIGAAAESNHRLKATLGGLKSFSWLKNQDQPKLDAEKKSIQERLKAVGVFRDTRVNWSGSLRTIAAAMPESTIITTVGGDAEIDAGSKSGGSRGKKKLIVSFETPLAGNGSLPQEIDGFLAALRADATLKRHFPLVEVSGFRANPSRQGSLPSASYSVVCLPIAEKSKNAAGSKK